MKETYIGVMHELHDKVAAKIEAGEVRDDFAGLGLSQKGDGTLVKDGESEVVIKNLRRIRNVEEHLLRKSLILSKGLIFEKTLFFNMLRHAGEFVTFCHISKSGETHSVPLKHTTTVRKRAWKHITLSFLVAAVIGCLAGFLIWELLSSEGQRWQCVLVCGLIGAFIYGIAGPDDLYKTETTYVSEQWDQVRSSGDRQQVVKFLWPNGQDAEFKGNRSSWSDESQVRCRVHFPERSAEMNEEIARVIAAGLAIDAKPLIVAHYKAIGIGESSIVPLPADPFICLETSSSVIVFPHTVFGEITEETEMTERLKSSFASLPFQRQN